MNVKNLRLLADYLAALPKDYKHFDMDRYIYTEGHDYIKELDKLKESDRMSCGTVGCAIGHAPLVKGLPEMIGNDFTVYSEKIFEIDSESEEWEWCFLDDWTTTDNTPHGAAQRIYWLLENEVPDNWSEQMQGEEPLCYKDIELPIN